MRNKGEARLELRLAVVMVGRNVCFLGGGGAPDTSGQNEAARMNAEIAKEMWGQYKTTYLPKEQQFADAAFNYDTETNRQKQAGLASADVASAFAGQRGQSAREMASMGIDPSSGAWADKEAKMRIAEAAAGAGAQNAARTNVENMGYARKQDAISIGKGMPGTASGAMAQAGNTYGAIANTQMQNDQNNSANVGGTVRGGMDAYKLYKGFKNGGIVRKPTKGKCMAAGGIVINPRMKQVMDNSAASAGVPVAQGADPTAQAIDTAKTVKQGVDLYKSATAPAATGLAAMEGSAPIMAVEYAAPAIATEAAGTAAAAGAAEGGLTAALASNPVGWAVGAGLLLNEIFKKDGGEVEARGDRRGDKETKADELREGRKDLRKGGNVQGKGTGTSDSVPAHLSDGEYVLNSETVKMVGKKNLDKLNAAGLARRYGVKGVAA